MTNSQRTSGYETQARWRTILGNHGSNLVVVLLLIDLVGGPIYWLASLWVFSDLDRLIRATTVNADAGYLRFFLLPGQRWDGFLVWVGSLIVLFVGVRLLFRLDKVGSQAAEEVAAKAAEAKKQALEDQQRKTTEWHETMASEYGACLHTVEMTYIGGHPEYRNPGKRASLMIREASPLFVDSPKKSPTLLFSIAFGRVLQTKALGDKEKMTVWQSDVPIPLTWTVSDTGTVAVEFVNDVGDHSVVGFAARNSETAAKIADDVYHAIYHWKKQNLVK